MSVADGLSVLLCVGFPLLALLAIRRGWFPGWLSSIIACYGIGIVVANLRLWATDQALLEGVAAASMVFGLPLLLFSVRLRESFAYAGKMLLAFGICCLAGLVCTATAGWYFADEVADGWKIAGMLVGLYSGGTPNVQAIGIALEAPTNYVILIQAADVLLGGSYLLGLVTFLPALYARFYPTPAESQAAFTTEDSTAKSPSKRAFGLQFLVALLTALAAAGLTWLLTGSLANTTLLILLLTTLALAASTAPYVRALGNTYPLGEYFILIFCVALGLLADFRQLAAEGRDLLLFSALALTLTTVLHLLVCKWLKIDRDTVILSSVAAFYGPVFVVQVAAALGNRRLLAAGVAVSLLGLGLGNYLGIGLAYLLRWLAY